MIIPGLRYSLQLQLHSSVHFHCVFLHEHLPPQPLEFLQPHFTSSVQTLEATGRVIHTGDHLHSLLNFDHSLLSTKYHLGRKLVYSAAAEHLGLVELFPLLYFLTEELFPGFTEIACLVTTQNCSSSLKCFHSIVNKVYG